MPALTENGAENITNFPYGPEHMIVGKGKAGKVKRGKS